MFTTFQTMFVVNRTVVVIYQVKAGQQVEILTFRIIPPSP